MALRSKTPQLFTSSRSDTPPPFYHIPAAIDRKNGKGYNISTFRLKAGEAMEGRHVAPSGSARDPRRAPEAVRRPRGYRPRRRRRSGAGEILRLALRDLLLLGLILVVFAFFHHVLPRMTGPAKEGPAPVALATPAPAQTPAPPAETAGPDPAAIPEPTPEPTPDPMDWKTKFAEQFSDTVEIGEDYYRSPDISIRLTKVTNDDRISTTYFIADIYIAHLENFRTVFAGDSYRSWAAESVLSAAERHGAILCMNGDYADAQYSGLLIRNGELYLSEQTKNDICVMYADGTVATYGPNDYKAEEIIAAAPYQVWKFGPALLDAEGQPLKSFNTSKEISWENPRSGFGYFEPGHYCFILVDGRQNGYSRGLEIDRFAQLFADLGCKAAYNMDGGRSSVMSFNGAVYNRPYLSGRDSGDFLMICELPPAAEESEN